MTQSQGDPGLLRVLKIGGKLLVDYMRWLHIGPVVFVVVVVSSFYMLALGGLALGPLFEVPGLRALLEPYFGTGIQVDTDDITRFWRGALPYLYTGAAVAAMLDEAMRITFGTSILRVLSRTLGLDGPWTPLRKFSYVFVAVASPILLLILALGGMPLAELPQLVGFIVLVAVLPVGWIVLVDHVAGRLHRKIDRIEPGDLAERWTSSSSNS